MVEAVDQTIFNVFTPFLQMNSINREITFRNCTIIAECETNSSVFIVRVSMYVVSLHKKEEILDGKLQFLCSVCKRSNYPEQPATSQNKPEQTRTTWNDPEQHQNQLQTGGISSVVQCGGSQHIGE